MEDLTSRRGKFIAKVRVEKGMTQEMLARKIGVDVGTLARWERGAQQVRPRNQAALAEALAITLSEIQDPGRLGGTASSGTTPSRELRTTEFISWIASRCDRPFDEVYRVVSERTHELESQSPAERYGQAHGHAEVQRSEVFDFLSNYYSLPSGPVGFYTADIANEAVSLGILVEPTWVGNNIDLLGNGENVSFHSREPGTNMLPDACVSAAVDRLAVVEATSKVMVNNPMYRLTSFGVETRTLTTEFDLVEFADYALRDGCLENETIEAVAEMKRGGVDSGAEVPLRSSLLPTIEAVTNLKGRYCTGGIVSLLAVARPGNNDHPPDYALFVQVRGKRVMDIPGKLSTVPKGWHQPVGEPSSQARLGTTLIRELEEELFGRQDLELLVDEPNSAALPLHQQHRSKPVAELLDNPGALQARCSGLGLNALSGTYEIPCLLVIDDEHWWTEWGHTMTGNWETSRINIHSTIDPDGLTSLIRSPQWTNEGLFSLLEGLRLLGQIGSTDRLAQPVQR